MNKILIMGLPGSGKTTLAKILCQLLPAVHFNADEIRNNINKDLGFSHSDRIEHAKRMGWLCDQVVKSGNYAVADFVCPTPETRKAFMQNGNAFVIWVDRIKTCHFEDTNKLFVPPVSFDIKINESSSLEYWANKISKIILPVFEDQKPTALFIGRYQPFHEGHKTLILEGIKRVGQACIAVRDTYNINENNPFSFLEIKMRIENVLAQYKGKFNIIQIPNITNVFYGRNVGYIIEKIELDKNIEEISATKQRELL